MVIINYIRHFCQTNHWTLFTFLVLISFACQSQVNRLDISDPRLPSEAKQRIADAEDALIIAEAERRTAELQLLKAQTEQSRLNEAPSVLVQQRSFELMLQEPFTREVCPALISESPSTQFLLLFPLVWIFRQAKFHLQPHSVAAKCCR